MLKIIFMILSLIVLIYLIYIFKKQKRIHILVEVFYIGIYGFVFLYAFFYDFFQIVFSFFNIENPSIFFVYISIFIIFLICLTLYRKTENQRVEITKLVSEIAILKNQNSKKRDNE